MDNRGCHDLLHPYRSGTATVEIWNYRCDDWPWNANAGREQMFSICTCENHDHVNTTPHVHLRSVKLYKEFSYRFKVNKFGALTTTELVSRHTERQAQQCVK